MVEAHDGELIPLSIVYNKDIVMNGDNGAFLFGYGAYGTSLSPFFSPTFLYWVSKGGVFCVPHVRGGGEKGENWHNAGKKINKENTWKDLISCTEYLIKEGFTNKDKTVIYSMSAGGIMVGRAVTERPDLFKVMIAEAANLNPYRTESRTDGGGSNIKEYGTVKDSLEFLSLIDMDPYLNLQLGKNYPSMLITAGENDQRIPRWMPGKFAAKAQNVTKSSNPILYQLIKDSGHGDFTETEQFYLSYANMFAFSLWQIQHPDFITN